MSSNYHWNFDFSSVYESINSIEVSYALLHHSVFNCMEIHQVPPFSGEKGFRVVPGKRTCLCSFTQQKSFQKQQWSPEMLVAIVRTESHALNQVPISTSMAGEES